MNNLFSSEEHWREWIERNPAYAETEGVPVGESLRRVVAGEFRINPGDITD